MVGDRPETDGRFAVHLGCPFALVRSGVTAPSALLAADEPIAVDARDLADLVALLVGSPGGEQ